METQGNGMIWRAMMSLLRNHDVREKRSEEIHRLYRKCK